MKGLLAYGYRTILSWIFSISFSILYRLKKCLIGIERKGKARNEVLLSFVCYLLRTHESDTRYRIRVSRCAMEHCTVYEMS